MNQLSQKKLLAIDGGGIRGILALRVLKRIESIVRERSGNPGLVLADYFDYIGGTSTGGIIAAALAIGMSVDELERFYREEAPRLFALTANPVKRLLYARYDASALRDRLQEVFGKDTTMGSDKLKTLLLVVVLNATTNSPWPVSSNPKAKYNDPARGLESNLNLPLWQLVRASTAAPYFFEPEMIQIHQGGKPFYFYDGALTSLINPAYKLFQMATLPCYRVEWPTGADRMLLVSVGTGVVPKKVERLRLLEKQVGSTMMTAMQSLMVAGAAEVDMQCRGVSRVLAGDPIDSEVGDFVGSEPIGGVPLFTYLRYNAQLDSKGLRAIGCEHLSHHKFRLDDLGAIDPCAEIGDAVAERKVGQEHFERFM